ncbi:GPO family capsid scaffolding protein, partial [Aeromonas jandaei]
MSSEVTTGWVCIASSGHTATEREIKSEWLIEMASNYDPDFYTATMWPEHSRTEPMGHVTALKTAIENGITKLFAILKPNLALIEMNKEGKLCFCSIEPRPNFAKSGKMYLAALGLTDTPDSTGTTALKFNAQSDTPRGTPMQWAGSHAEKRDNAFFSLLAQEAQALNKQFQHIKSMTHDMTKQFSVTNAPTSEPVKMDINAITRDFRFSFSQRDGFLDPVASAALTSALAQSSPLLSRITFLHVPDPHAAQFDGFKPGLRTGRRTGERFEVKASPRHTPPELNEMDSGTVFSWGELSQILGRMTQQQANEVLQGLMLIAVAEDIIRIGFHGIAAEAETDPAAHPNGEDVARGWHQTAKDADKAGERVLLAPVTFDVKGGGDHADLDTMAYHLLDKLPKEGVAS